MPAKALPKSTTPTGSSCAKSPTTKVSLSSIRKGCSPLLDNAAIEKKIQDTIKQFYLMVIGKFGPEIIKPLINDLYFFAIVKHQQEICGFILFAITPALTFGTIKVINLLGTGLEKAILSAIIELIPQTKQIFLFARPTNTTAVERYKALGFIPNLLLSDDPHHKVNTHYLIPLERDLLAIAASRLNGGD